MQILFQLWIRWEKNIWPWNFHLRERKQIIDKMNKWNIFMLDGKNTMKKKKEQK